MASHIEREQNDCDSFIKKEDDYVPEIKRENFSEPLEISLRRESFGYTYATIFSKMYPAFLIAPAQHPP